MSIVLRSNKVTAVLLPDGWHPAVEGTFEIDILELRPDPGVEASSDDWAFTFTDEAGATVMGRMTTLLAVREA